MNTRGPKTRPACSATRLKRMLSPMSDPVSRLRAVLKAVVVISSVSLTSCDSDRRTDAEQDMLQSSETGAIEIRPVNFVPSPDSVGFGGLDFNRISLSSDGTVWVSPWVAPFALLRVGGNEVRSLTRRGQGPREFVRIGVLESGPNDTLHVLGFDKISLFAPNGDFVRTSPVPVLAGHGMTVLSDGSYVILGSGRGASLPIHVISADGVELRTLAPPESLRNTGRGGPTTIAASSEPGAFWVADRNGYEVHLMDVEGRVLRTIARDVDWFPEWTEWQAPFEDPPLPRLFSVQEDHLGRLWVMLSVAATDFQPLPGSLESAGAGANDPMGNPNPSFDTVIDVLDARTGELIATRRFSALIVEFLPRQHIAIPEIEPDGDQAFRIVQLVLNER